MSTEIKYTPRELYNLKITLLQTDPNQPRKSFNETALSELAESIKTIGILQPILFRLDNDGNHIIVAGERRYRASIIAGIEDIPAIYTDGNAAEIALVENMLREDLTAVEEAEALAKMRDDYKYTQDQLAQLLGMSRNTVSEILSINNLPMEIKNDCREDMKCSKKKLIEIAKEKSQNKMVKLYDRIKNYNMSVADLRNRRVKGRVNQDDVVVTQIVSLRKKVETLPKHLDDKRKDHLVSEFEKLVEVVSVWLKEHKKE